MTEETKREQTLLEAAKDTIVWWGIGSMPDQIRALKAAIAREEAKPSDTTVRTWEAIADEWMEAHSEQRDRAQQAEADAKWHREESARLSAELALAKNQMTLAIERSERLSGQMKGCEYDLGQAGKLRQRAEKAEGERGEALLLLGAGPNETLVQAVKRTLHGISSINGIHAAAGARPGIDDVTAKVLELRRRAEKAEAELEKRRADGVVAAQDACDLRARVMLAEAEVKHLTRCNDKLGAVTIAQRKRAEFAEGMIARALGVKS